MLIGARSPKVRETFAGQLFSKRIQMSQQANEGKQVFHLSKAVWDIGWRVTQIPSKCEESLFPQLVSKKQIGVVGNLELLLLRP